MRNQVLATLGVCLIVGLGQQASAHVGRDVQIFELATEDLPDLRDGSMQDWEDVLATNLTGPFYFTRAAARIMLKQRGGRVLNISSVVGLMGNVGQANYAASKAGIIGVTKSLARELGPRGVTVNAIAPGFITTDMTSGLKDEHQTRLRDAIPLGAFGEPEDVAAAACYLASDAAKYVTGQVIQVDGGMRL